ncbi:unnamed protein product [Anisakis simplex]|uniref:CHM2A protein n=1 Tax=Anisakis simplex TaxID=6269 RepID=A0A0M3JNL1_ANISI|nr:unnamed protein product [Anisakis simplex]
MRSRDAVSSGEEGSERDDSLRRDSDADLDSLDDKINRMLDQMDAQQERSVTCNIAEFDYILIIYSSIFLHYQS